MHVKVHEKYRRDFHDLALLKLDREIHFSASVAPICVPTDPAAFSDLGGRGHVAGWGHVRNRACHTGALGPAPFTQCAFPFVWRNKTHSGCALEHTPSQDDPTCR